MKTKKTKMNSENLRRLATVMNVWLKNNAID